MTATKNRRNRLCAAALLLADALILAALRAGGHVTLLQLTDRLQISFAVDGLARCVLPAVMLLYTAVLFYAFSYMEQEEHQGSFFVFYLLSFGALAAVCLSANLATLYLCFEFLTLTSMPLVLHERTKEAVTAGLKYLFYSMGGALMGLLAVFFVYRYTDGCGTFLAGGFLQDALLAGNEKVFLGVVMAGILGFGTKAGLYPMHGWLPAAHPVAPAPASALLSGIVAKAGVIALIRLVYYAVGPARLAGTWVQTLWMSLSLLTIFMGSMMAFQEKILKKRLAYSTISQISYILLALSFLRDDALAGGLLHLLGHCAAKGCLFLCAGVCVQRLGVRDVRCLKGAGRQIPVTMACFAIASLSLVGIPPLAGFTSKWVIGSAAIASGIPVFRVLAPVMLLISALLTAGYLFPVVTDAFFPEMPERPERLENPESPENPAKDPGNESGSSREGAADAASNWSVRLPMLALCMAALGVGLFGAAFVSLCGFSV